MPDGQRLAAPSHLGNHVVASAVRTDTAKYARHGCEIFAACSACFAFATSSIFSLCASAMISVTNRVNRVRTYGSINDLPSSAASGLMFKPGENNCCRCHINRQFDVLRCGSGQSDNQHQWYRVRYSRIVADRLTSNQHWSDLLSEHNPLARK